MCKDLLWMLRHPIKALGHEKYGELLRFVLCGALTTAVNFAVYLPSYHFLFRPRFSPEFSAILANSIAWVLAVLFAFFVNKYIVFRSETHSGAGFLYQILSFYATRALSGVGEVFLPSLLIYIGLHDVAAKLIVAALVLVCNYLTSKFIAFRRQRT